MSGILYRPPKIAEIIYSDSYWRTANDKILLTFDDGPNPGTTEIILKILNENRINALFFCVGRNLIKYPALASEIDSEGHILGNHTMNHRKLLFKKRNFIENEITSCGKTAEEKFNIKMKFFRPPYGKILPSTEKLITSLGYKNIMWSLMTADYKNDINIVKFAVKKYLKKDSIIVLHDSERSKEIILREIEFIISEAERRNFKFGNVSECLS